MYLYVSHTACEWLWRSSFSQERAHYHWNPPRSCGTLGWGTGIANQPGGLQHLLWPMERLDPSHVGSGRREKTKPSQAIHPRPTRKLAASEEIRSNYSRLECLWQSSSCRSSSDVILAGLFRFTVECRARRRVLLLAYWESLKLATALQQGRVAGDPLH